MYQKARLQVFSLNESLSALFLFASFAIVVLNLFFSVSSFLDSQRNLTIQAEYEFKYHSKARVLGVSTPTISSVNVTKPTKSGFMIDWVTSTPGKTFKIKYGLTSAYGFETWVFTDPGSTRRQVALTGLKPATTYHFCPEHTDTAGNVSTCDGVTNDFTGTTLAGNTLPASLPELPRVYVDTTMPTQTGTVRNVPAGDCGNPTTGLQAQMNAAQYGDTIVIPAGTVCTGQFTAPPKSGSGWIIVRTSTPDASLPSQGTRLSPSYIPALATIRTNLIGAQWTGSGKMPVCGTGEGGKISYKADDTGKIGVYECRSDTTYFEVPNTSGTTVPTTCTEGAWFYKTNATRGKHIFRCVAPNTMEELNLANYAGNTEALVFPSGSKNWRFIGIDITHVPMPNVTLNYDSQKNPRLPGNQYNGLVVTEQGSDKIIFDRVYVHGLDFPSRVWGGFAVQGTNFAVIDSVIDKINMWTAADPNSVESQQPAIQIGYTQGPAKIVNNQITCIGICVFATEGPTGSYTVSDVEVRGNYFFKPLKYLYGSAESDGRRYFTRHHLELKRGRRWLIDGNIFENNWAAVQQGASIALTPRPVYPNSFTEDNGISDITITNNIIKNSTTGIVMTGLNDFVVKDQGNANISGRYRVSNNLFFINGKLADPLGWYPSGRSGNPIMLFNGVEDAIIDHNTVTNTSGNSPSLMYTSCNQPSSGLEVRDNIADIPVGSYGFLWGEGCKVLEGLGALNEQWSLFPYTPAYNVTNNVFVGKPSSASKYPSGNFFPAAGGVSFANPGGGDYTLTTPTYKGKASDGKDPGVNMSALNTATQYTLTGGGSSIFVPLPSPAPSPTPTPTPVTPSPTPVTPTPTPTPAAPIDTTAPAISNISVQSVGDSAATIVWVTDEQSDSQVEYGATSSYGSTSNINSGRVTFHAVTIYGLSASTVYNFRVKSRDTSGNLAISANSVFTTTPPSAIDTFPPAVSLTSLSDGQTVSGNITLSAIASDDKLLSSLKYYIDTRPFGKEFIIAPFDQTLDTTSLADGKHTIYVEARDAAGNSAKTAQISFVVANTAVAPTPVVPTPQTQDFSGLGYQNNNSVTFPSNAKIADVVKFKGYSGIYLVYTDGLHQFTAYSPYLAYVRASKRRVKTYAQAPGEFTVAAGRAEDVTAQALAYIRANTKAGSATTKKSTIYIKPTPKPSSLNSILKNSIENRFK